MTEDWMPAEGYGVTYLSRRTWTRDGKWSDNWEMKEICEKSCNRCISYQRKHALNFVLHSSHSVISKCHITSLLNKAAFPVVVSSLRKAQIFFLFYYPSLYNFYKNLEQSLYTVCPVMCTRMQAKRGCLSHRVTVGTLRSVAVLLCKYRPALTLILLTWRKWWAPNNASKWQMGFNSAFKGLKPSRNFYILVIWTGLKIILRGSREKSTDAAVEMMKKTWEGWKKLCSMFLRP